MFRSPRLLIAARVLGGLTQSQLADAAGIAVSALSAIEQGKSDPRLSTAIALLDALEAHGIRLLPGSQTSACGLEMMTGSRAEQLSMTGFADQTDRDEGLGDAVGLGDPTTKRIGRGYARKRTT